MDPELQAMLAKAAQPTAKGVVPPVAPPPSSGMSLQDMLAQAAQPTPGVGNQHNPGDLALEALLPKELQGANTSLPPAPVQQPPPHGAADPDANKTYADELPDHDRARIIGNVQKMQAQGAPDADIEQYLSGVEGLSKRADLGPARQALGPGETVANGLTLGAAPYIGGAADATLDKIGDVVTGENNGSWMEKYRYYRDLAKDLDTGFASEHPVVHGLTKGVASIPPSVLLAEMVPGAWIGKGFVNKATASGIGGLLAQSEENAAGAGGNGPAFGLVNRAKAVLHENPAEGFAAGVGGAALAPAARGLKNIFSPNIADAAAEQLGNVAGNDLGQDAADKMTQRAQEFVQAGKPARVFDVAGRGVRQRAAAAQSVPGPGKEDIARALEDRNSLEGDRVLSDLEQHSGASTDNAYTTGQQLAEAQSARAKPLYDAARAKPVSQAIVDRVAQLRQAFPELEKIFAHGEKLRAGDDALSGGSAGAGAPTGQAATLARVQQTYGNDPKMLAFVAKQLGTTPDALTAASGPSMDVGTIHYAKKALDDLLDPMFNSQKSIPPRRAAQLYRAFRGLLDQMETEVPEYRLARTTFKGDAEAREALGLGQSIMDPANIRNPEEIRAAVAQMSPNEQALFKQGAYDAIRKLRGNVNDSRSVANALFGNPNRKGAPAAMFDNDAEYQAFLQKVGMEQTLRKNATDVIQGSRTTPLAQDIQDMTGRVGAGDVLSGIFSPRRVGRSLMRKQGNIVTRGNTESIVNELARMMNTKVGTPEFDAVMRALQRLPQQAAQRDAVNLGTATAAGSLTAGNAPR